MPQRPLQQLVEEAQQLVYDNQPQLAAALYAEILARTETETASPQINAIRFKALAERGRILYDLGDVDLALACHEQYVQEADDDHHRVKALEALGSTLRHMGRFQEARERYEASLALAEKIMYPSGRAKALEGLGTYHHLLGHGDEAQRCLQMAYSLFKSAGDVAGQVTTLTWLGLAQSYGEIDKAIATFNEALLLARKINHFNDMVILLDNQGENYQELFAIETAIQIHQEALQLAEEKQLQFILSDLYRNLGVEFGYLERYEEATHYLLLALQLSQSAKDVEIEAQVLYSLGVMEVRQGRVEQAQRFADQLNQLADFQKSLRFQARGRYVSGLVKQKRGDVVAAAAQWQEALFLAHQSHQQSLLWQIHSSLAEINTSPGLAMAHWRIAAEIIQQIAHPIQDQTLKQTFLQAPPIAKVLAQVK